MRPVSTALCGLAAAGCCAAAGVGHRRRQDATPTSSVFVLPSASPAANVNASEYDLTRHYCRLWRHASVVADGKIYVDGGETYVPKNNGTFNTTPEGDFIKGINNHLLVIDLSKNFSTTDTAPYSRILKGPEVPSSLMEHALWFSRATRKLYQIGGWWSASNVDDPGFKDLTEIPESELWEFDLAEKVWKKPTDLVIKNKGKLQRPGAAAYCDAPTVGRSYLFQGYVEQRSDKDNIDYKQWSEFKFIEGLLELDTSDTVTKPTLTNISVPLQMGGKDFGPRMNGAMVHVPVGKQGVLVQIGGQITLNPTPYGQRLPEASGGNINIPLSFVDIYDIESGFWFRQQTFGIAPDGIPSGRSDICAVVVPAPDNSSFNIFMVGGVDNYATHTTKGEIWVLSLPTFQWILVHSAIETAIYGHTCHAIGENLVIVGGMFMTQYGDVGNCASTMPANVFSLSTLNYTSTYDAAGATRAPLVPEKVVTAVGGTGRGGAYILAPKVWSDLYLQYVFNPSLPRPSYTPTYALADPGDPPGGNTTKPDDNQPEPGPAPLSGGAIAGIVIGTLVAVAALVGAVLFFLRRRRHGPGGSRRGANELPSESLSEHEKPGYLYGAPGDKPVAEMSTHMRSELGSDEHAVSELPAGGADYHSEAGWSGITPTASRTKARATPATSATGSPFGGFAGLERQDSGLLGQERLAREVAEEARREGPGAGDVSPLGPGDRTNT